MKKLLLSSAFALCLASPAFAADVLVEEPAQPIYEPGYYISVHGGVKFGEDWEDEASQTFDFGGGVTLDLAIDGEAQTDDGTIFGIAVGKEFNQWFAAEIEVNKLDQDFESLDIDNISGVFKFNGDPFADFDIDCNDPACSGIGLDGDLDVITGMINAIVGIPIVDGLLRPYFGVGVGLARVHADVGISEGGVSLCCLDDSDTVFAFQGMVGIDLRLTENIAIGGRARLIQLSDIELEDDAGFHHDIDPDIMNTAEAVLTFSF